MRHIDIPTPEEFKALAATRSDFCVSLYVPTSPEHPQGNRIAFKDLAEEALSQLREAGIPKRRIEPFKEQFGRLSGRILDNPDDNKFRYRDHDPAEPIEEFWRSQANGLAVLARPETMQTFRLPERPKPLAEVADRYHLTPIIRVMTSPQEIVVLALSEGSGRLVHVFVNMPPVRVPIPNLPKDAADATGRPSVHVRAPRGRLQNLEGEKVLDEEYARKVDKAVRSVLAGQTVPMVLAASEPLATIFRTINSYQHFVDDRIEGSPDHVSDAQLAEAALPILRRLYRNEVKAILALHDELKPYRSTTDISHAAHAVTGGAVDKLLVDLDTVIPGLVSDLDGSVTYSASDDAETYSVLDEVARRALCTDARVLSATGQELPNGTQIVAILRYRF